MCQSRQNVIVRNTRGRQKSQLRLLPLLLVPFAASLLVDFALHLAGRLRQSSRGPLLCQLQIRKILNASQVWLTGRDLPRLQRLAAFVAVHCILQ